MKYLPTFMDVRNHNCLVVGGGNIAARKMTQLHEAGAIITLVSPTLDTKIEALQEIATIHWRQRNFVADDIDGMRLIIATTDDQDCNSHIAELAKARGIPVNVVDAPEKGTFITSAVIDRAPLQIAVSTGGASPVLSRMLRTHLESAIPAAYGQLAALVDEFRIAVKEKFPKPKERRHFWEKILEGPIAELVFAGKQEAAHQRIHQALASSSDGSAANGEVFLVGAGPGDPDLLTFRALRLMQKADVVVYDRLVSQPIMKMVRKDAEMIYVGKERNKHAVPQDNINTTLVRLAKEGKRVLRLKGGDPFIFGRGGEEIQTLVDEGINFQVVPGITAAAGCSSYAGIPLTHRDHAQAVIFVTGHLKDGSVNLNWEMLAHAHQTVVFYMGLHGASVICEQLMAHGRAANTPAALVERGTTPEQKVYIGDLTTLPELVKTHDIKPPTLIIIGEVVELHDKLRWFKPDQEITLTE